MLDHLTRLLTRREREVVRLRFANDPTPSHIGERIGVSQMQIFRILRGARTKLRTHASNRRASTDLGGWVNIERHFAAVSARASASSRADGR
jgi:DNA-directed RNA polymerase sigma subunit (sigma70/sigma32)